MWQLIGVLFFVLCILLVIFGLSLRFELRHSISWSQGLIVSFLLMLSTSGIFYSLIFNADRIESLAQYEVLLPDVALFLKTGDLSEEIKNLEVKSLISLLGFYGRAYPDDQRVWQKLAIIMINIDMPEQALKAIRRFLKYEPNNVEGRQVELQLLAQLVRQGNVISPRQLKFALESMIKRQEINPEDRLYIGGLAEEFGFYSLAATVWRTILAFDSQFNQKLSPEALEGRRLIEKLLASAEAKLESKVQDPAVPADESVKSLDARIMEQQIRILLSDQAQKAVRSYMQDNEARPFHLWMSLRAGGPPLAAKLIWGNNTLLSEDGLTFQFYEADLVQIPEQLSRPVFLSGLLVLNEEKSDPLAARSSQWQGQLTVDLVSEEQPKLNTLMIQSVKAPAELPDES